MSAPTSAPVILPPTPTISGEPGTGFLRLANMAVMTGSSIDRSESTLASIQPGRSTIRTSLEPSGECIRAVSATGARDRRAADRRDATISEAS